MKSTMYPQALSRVIRILKFFRAPWWSPSGLAVRAALIVLVFLVLHAAGLREYTSFISGTSPSGEPLTQTDCVLGGVYLMFFFATAVLTPILVIAAGIMYGVEKKMKGVALPVEESEARYE